MDQVLIFYYFRKTHWKDLRKHVRVYHHYYAADYYAADYYAVDYNAADYITADHNAVDYYVVCAAS